MNVLLTYGEGCLGMYEYVCMFYFLWRMSWNELSTSCGGCPGMSFLFLVEDELVCILLLVEVANTGIYLHFLLLVKVVMLCIPES